MAAELSGAVQCSDFGRADEWQARPFRCCLSLGRGARQQQMESLPPRSGTFVGMAMVFAACIANALKRGGAGLISGNVSILTVRPSPICPDCRLMQLIP